MAKGQTIDQLFLSLGLDTTQLDADFVTADKTVSQGIQELSRKQSQAKLRLEIDTSGFAGAENSVEALTSKENSLTNMLKIQKSSVLLVNAAYQESVKAKGADDAASQKMLTRLLKEQKAEASLAAQIRSVNKMRLEGALVSDASSVAGAVATATSGAFAKVGQATQSARNGINAVNASMASLMAIALTGAGLFTLVKGAVDAGDAIYKMSGKLNISADEASQLNRMLKVTDVDSQSFVSTMIRLDRSVETAGKSGNTTTKAMQEFGVSITDGNGKLLPMNDQLAQLAKGYDNAAKAGNEEAFVTELLGARGAALVPILRDYTEAAEAASKVKTVGIDPQEAHDLSVELKVLQMETTQLGNAFGAALMPVAKELAPRIIDGMQSMIQSIKDNKDAIVDTTNAIIDVGSAAGSALKEGIAPLFDYIIDHKDDIVGAFREIQTEIRLIKNHPVMGTLAATIPLFNNTDTIKGYMAEAKAQIDSENAVSDAKKQTEKDNARIAANNKILADAQARDAANAQAKIVADSKETLKAKEEIEAAIFHASHTTIENELYDIDDKTRKSITAGTDEKTAWELAELQKAEATKKYYKEVAENREQLAEALLKANGDELDARLMEIEKERKAWIEKTQDEVHATELAEQQKIKAVKDAVQAQYGSEIRAVQEAIKNGKDVGEAYAKAHQESIKNQQAENQAYDYVRKQAGVEMPGDVKTKMVIDGNTVSQLKEIVQKLTYDPSKLQKNAANTVSIGTISVSLPVQNTGSADLDMPKIADQAADIITKKIQSQLGGDDNGY